MKKKVLLGILVIFLIALVPLFALKDAEFGGSDDAGSQVVEEVDSSYEPWAVPVLEQLIGGEHPCHCHYNTSHCNGTTHYTDTKCNHCKGKFFSRIFIAQPGMITKLVYGNHR